jgi:hypothetical protein
MAWKSQLNLASPVASPSGRSTLIGPGRSSRFRFSRLMSARSLLVIPGQVPAFTSAWRTRLRSVSAHPAPSLLGTAQIAGQSGGYFGRTAAIIGTGR